MFFLGNFLFRNLTGNMGFKKPAMQKCRRMLRRRATLHFINCLVILLLLTVWMVARKPDSPGKAIPYSKAPGHILVQLAELHERAEVEIYTDPLWTLYGDGTLIFKTDPSDTLWRAQLALSDIQHILDVITNQQSFFASTAQRYEGITLENDDDELLLTVNANGQQKEVMLASERTNQVVSDLQTAHVVAIEQFLLAYHPVHSMFYAPNPGSDRASGNGQ
jgi:hypothetical protein